MAMTPEEKAEFDTLKKMVQAMHEGRDLAFIEIMNRRLSFLPDTAVLQDLADVEDTTDASTGQVLKKTATTWQPGTDETT